MQEGVPVLAAAKVEGAADAEGGQRGGQAGGTPGDQGGTEGGQDPGDDPQGAGDEVRQLLLGRRKVGDRRN